MSQHPFCMWCVTFCLYTLLKDSLLADLRLTFLIVGTFFFSFSTKVGSFARGLFLVHSECLETNYISSRPFRVNAVSSDWNLTLAFHFLTPPLPSLSFPFLSFQGSEPNWSIFFFFRGGYVKWICLNWNKMCNHSPRKHLSEYGKLGSHQSLCTLYRYFFTSRV